MPCEVDEWRGRMKGSHDKEPTTRETLNQADTVTCQVHVQTSAQVRCRPPGRETAMFAPGSI